MRLGLARGGGGQTGDVLGSPDGHSKLFPRVIRVVASRGEWDGPKRLIGWRPQTVFQDKTLECVECEQQFVFSVDDQQYHAERGYTDPKRCPECRRARRSQLGSGGGSRADRQMYPAVCAQCGRDTEVPFEPRGDRPVYCNECFAQQRSSSAY